MPATNLIRTYTELIRIPTFKERFEYLQLNGIVGEKTFGFDRYLNQAFYHSDDWRKYIRPRIISRDLGRDLGCIGRDIRGPIYIHHMNPMMIKDLIQGDEKIIDPEFLICTSYRTHQAIHYGDVNLLDRDPVERTPNDTCPWKQRR